MAINFSEILSKQVGSAPEPKPLPQGTYSGVITKRPDPVTIKTKEGEKGQLYFTIRLTEAQEDVDQDALLEAGVKQDYDCRVGTCGTCAVTVVEGEADHRDNVLLDAEKAEKRMCTCVSRALTPRLVINL